MMRGYAEEEGWRDENTIFVRLYYGNGGWEGTWEGGTDAVLWIRIRIRICIRMYPDHFGNLDPHPQKKIRICIRVISWIQNRIRIRINLQMTSQNVRNFELLLALF
jgi:hypothetical protein